jgi:subtilisin family serine protease
MKTKSSLKLAKLFSLFATLVGVVYIHAMSNQIPPAADAVAASSSSGEQAQDLSSNLASTDNSAQRKLILGDVVTSNKDPKDEINVLMKDPSVHKKWGLVMTETHDAWRVTRGSRDIVVAIIDTGVDLHHPELQKSFWINKGETGLDKNGRNKMNNGIDDDGDGYVDDVYGWNFVDNTNDVADAHGHGTHIAGIIGAQGIHGSGFSGISPNISLMILKYFDKTESPNTLKNTVQAINFAVDHGANIINYSGGGLDPSPAEKRAIQRALDKGILVVAAAGNERSNSDIRGYYPADYGLSNVISVTAIDKTRHVLPSSNYGEHSVDIAAPGNDIFSTLPNGKYGYLTGTSQATAFVTGVAALVMANNRELKAPDVIKYLTRTGDIEEQLDGKTRYRRRLNSYKALTTLDQGVGATGVIAGNAVGLKPEMFLSEPPNKDEVLPTASVEQLSQFGQVVQRKLTNVQSGDLN